MDLRGVMERDQLHKTQVSILHALRYSPKERFSTLMKPTGHMSDTFKFHLQKLVKLGHVEKISGGEYRLTISGRLYANALDEAKGAIKKQPKLSVLVVAKKENQTGAPQYLLFKRSRNPFMDYWAAMTDVVRRGETFEDAAARVLFKHTSLHADFELKTIARIRNFTKQSNTLLEDMAFAVMLAKNINGTLSNNYLGGKNAWLTMEELLLQEKYFASMPEILKSTSTGFSFMKQDLQHRAKDF
jgi:ADP-ribose pyrophosphatase YjhB (NUDIX family)